MLKKLTVNAENIFVKNAEFWEKYFCRVSINASYKYETNCTHKFEHKTEESVMQEV